MIVISILDYNFIPYEESITKAITVLEEHKEYEINKYQKYYYIELPKFRKENLEIGNKVSEWLTFIDGENRKRVEEVMGSNKLIKKADKEYKYLVGDERIRRLAELEERTRLEMSSARLAGYKEGIEKVAKTMLSKGIGIEMISEITKLTKVEIDNLK